MHADLGDPLLVRSVRPANHAERGKIEEIRAIQARIRWAKDTGEVAFLADLPVSVRGFSGSLSTNIGTLTLAEETMDKGLLVD